MLLFQIPQGTLTFRRSKKSVLGHKTTHCVMPPSITTAYKCAMLVRHKLWGDDRLGGGLSAFSRLPSYVRSRFLPQTRDEEASCWLWALKQQLIKVILSGVIHVIKIIRLWWPGLAYCMLSSLSTSAAAVSLSGNRVDV